MPVLGITLILLRSATATDIPPTESSAREQDQQPSFPPITPPLLLALSLTCESLTPSPPFFANKSVWCQKGTPRLRIAAHVFADPSGDNFLEGGARNANRPSPPRLSPLSLSGNRYACLTLPLPPLAAVPFFCGSCGLRSALAARQGPASALPDPHPAGLH